MRFRGKVICLRGIVVRGWMEVVFYYRVGGVYYNLGVVYFDVFFWFILFVGKVFFVVFGFFTE